jgi:hypothetical protein
LAVQREKRRGGNDRVAGHRKGRSLLQNIGDDRNRKGKTETVDCINQLLINLSMRGKEKNNQKGKMLKYSKDRKISRFRMI